MLVADRIAAADTQRAPGPALVLLALVMIPLAGAGATGAADSPQLAFERMPDGVRLLESGKPVLFYRRLPARGAEAWRTNYIHPIWALSGDVLTEDAPADHLHHRGAFWAWRRILVDGAQVADGWIGGALALESRPASARILPDGSAELSTATTWSVPLHGVATPIIAENARIRAYPAQSGRRRIEIHVALRALRDGVALAGTDDEKGYGGLSIRLKHPDRLDIASGDRTIVAIVGPVATGDTVRFSWREPTPLRARRVDLTCRIDGRPWRSWILRQELSMQNCAFPGRKPVAIPVERAVELEFVIVHD